MRARTRICLLAAGCAAFCAGGAALGQEGVAEATRRELIRDAEEASAHGDHGRAVDLATRAAQVRMTPSLRMFLAMEFLELRDWLRAYAAAVQCQGEVRADPSVPRRRRLLATCARVEARATPHIGFVVIHPPADADGLHVRVAGAEVQAALLGVRYPVAAGAVTVDASAPGGSQFHTELRVSEGQSSEVTIALVTSPPAPPSAPLPATPSTPPPAAPLPPPIAAAVTTPPPSVQPIATPILVAPTVRPSSPPGRGSRWVGPVVLGASGVIVLGLAGVFGALRSSARDARDVADANEFSPPGAAQAEHDNFQTYTWATNVSLGVGGACVAAGALWFVLSRSSATSPSASALAPGLIASQNGASLSLQGVW